MTIYDKITIGGSTVTDCFSSQVRKKSGDTNAASNFSASIDNFNGKNSNSYSVGDEVIFYADKDINPPTTKIFTGILETKRFPSRELKQNLTLQGRDYTARLMDRTVEPEVYTNLPAGSIVKDIINKYTDDITITNVNDSPITVERITFNHTPVFDAVKKLAELAGYTFYVDNDKDLHFIEKSSESSGQTFDNTNSTRTNFVKRRDTVFNEIWVYGDRYLDSYKEEATSDGAGSVVSLVYKPHNTRVDVGSPITDVTRQKGAIDKMSVIPTSGVNYLINYDNSEIIFASGTSLGYSSIPANGQLITVDYQRSLPIVKVGKDNDSIKAYGKRIKKILDKSIKDPTTAQERLAQELSDSVEPKIEGTLNINGIIDMTPSQTAIINLPDQDINNKTYDVLEVQYDFNKKKNREENVLTIQVNKKLNDITDTIKNLMNDVRTIQAQDIETADTLSRFEFTTGSLSTRQSGCKVYTRNIAGDTLIWGSTQFGVWNVGNWGDSTTSEFVLGHLQAGLLGINLLGSQASEWKLAWSGCYF